MTGLIVNTKTVGLLNFHILNRTRMENKITRKILKEELRTEGYGENSPKVLC